MKNNGIPIHCNECGHDFKKVIGPRTYEIRCPKCGSYDTELDTEFTVRCKKCGQEFTADTKQEAYQKGREHLRVVHGRNPKNFSQEKIKVAKEILKLSKKMYGPTDMTPELLAKAHSLPELKSVLEFFIVNKNPSSKRSYLIQVPCKRCGRMITTTPRALDHPLGAICERCITPEEQKKIMDYQVSQMMRMHGRNPIKCYWVAINRSTGEMAEQSRVYGKVMTALRGGLMFARKTWGKDDFSIEVYDHPHHYSEHYPKGEGLLLDSKGVNQKNPVNLYESFHGVPPVRKKKVYYESPPKELISIGELTQINYKPVRGKHKGTEFYHSSGDLGERKLRTNLVLATDKDGKNLYLVRKDKNSKYPVFSDKGILG